MARAKWTAADVPDMRGRTVVITGASSGIGLIAARELARAGAQVVLGVRDIAKGRAAVEGLPGDFDVRRLDVSDLGSVRGFVDAWDGPLDVLVNNSGVMDIPARRTVDGFDAQTATNFLGPFVLTNLLLPSITNRVVSVASQLHRQAKLNIADLDWRSRDYNQMQAYRDSKLAVVIFSLELQRRLEESGSPVRSVLVHPGIATTTLAAHSKRTESTPSDSSSTTLSTGHYRPCSPPLKTWSATPTSVPTGWAASKVTPPSASPARPGSTRPPHAGSGWPQPT